MSILLSPGFGYLSPPMRVTTQRATRAPSQANHGPPHVAPLLSPIYPLFLCARVLAHHESAPTLLLHATQRGQRHAVWGGTSVVPPHYRYPAPKGASHTPTSPHQSVSTQASKQAGQRGGGTTLSHHPTKAPTPRNANTKRRTRPARKHETQPPTEQTRPQQACSSTTRANTRSAHTLLCGRGSVSATGEPWKSRRPARTKRRHTTRARRQRTQKRANNQVCVRCAPAPAREDSAREGRSQ